MSKKTSVSLITVAWYLFAYSTLTKSDPLKVISAMVTGKLNLKAQLTADLNNTLAQLQKDPVNILLVLGISKLVEVEAHKIVGRKKIIELGGFRITM